MLGTIDIFTPFVQFLIVTFAIVFISLTAISLFLKTTWATHALMWFNPVVNILIAFGSIVLVLLTFVSSGLALPMLNDLKNNAPKVIDFAMKTAQKYQIYSPNISLPLQIA